MKFSLMVSLALLASACGQNVSRKEKISLETTGNATVVVMGAKNVYEIQNQARALGIKASGEDILILTGDSKKIEELEFVAGKDFDYVQDEKVAVKNNSDFRPDQKALYLAKKDFGYEDFKKIFPDADGRGVKVGVIDDGISPDQKGFIKTSTNERKFLKKGSQSTLTTYSLDDSFSTVIDEDAPAFNGKIDLNDNGKTEKISLKINPENGKVCIDLNTDNSYDDSECKGSFSTTGEYFSLKKGLSFVVEADTEKKKVEILLPEVGGDSHGEGVASVLAGHQIGGIEGFDGVAPGSQILDYDLSHKTNKAEEIEYSIGTFLKALEWNGLNGAEVVNISYSLFFSSTKAQTFMNKALSEVIKKYNMVVSFSAGNNGPGLGSLNRRGIYPSSALVAGAYISKELDEYVHGVTGIPEEGRVVYYSSRGPGLGVGPVLISPLSSLTNGTPNGGHMAFNGTSSASPALAGAAALLISAIKQNQLSVDANAVVHALRQSGERLKNEPFIFQGYGLPKLAKAFEIYKQIISGKKFLAVDTLSDNDSSDGVRHSGIFIRTSDNENIVSRRVLMSGKFSDLVSATDRANLLIPVRIQYSKGISGASRLWVSSSESRFFIDIDPEMVLNNKQESFGEIRVFSDLDDSLLAIVPVTVVNDRVLNLRLSQDLKIGSQEGARMHFYVPEGVKGFKISVETLEGEDRYARFSVFDPNHIRISQKAIGSDLWVPVKRSGHYQVGLALNGGTARKLHVKISVDTLNLHLKTKVMNAKSPSLKIYNGGQPISSKLKLTPTATIIDSMIFTPSELKAGGFFIEKELSEGTYQVALESNQVFDLSYEMNSCTTRVTKADGSIELSSGSASIPKEGARALFRCMPFDQGADFGSENVSWTLKISTTSPSLNQRLDVARKASADIKFDGIKAGIYSVNLEDPISGDLVKLGTVEVK